MASSHIAQACLDAYAALPRGGGKPHMRSNGRQEWTVLAGAVLELPTGSLHTLAVATGVKCLPYEHLSAHGDLLHDCHAEVLTRRSVRIWLLDRLLLEHREPASMPDGLPRLFCASDAGPSRWRLRDSVRIHWYISTLPCGELSSRVLHIAHVQQDGGAPARDADTGTEQGASLHRGHSSVHTGAAALVLRTKPGRRDAPPSISMSCTDKLTMWSALGIQGGLLSQWLDPVPIASVVISAPPDTLRAQALDVWRATCLQTRAAEFRAHCAQTLPPPSVHTTPVAFPDAFEEVDRRMRANTVSTGTPRILEDAQPVASAASVHWRRGAKVESVLGGIRLGASARRRRGAALAPSQHSALCKRAYLRRILQAAHDLREAGADQTSSGLQAARVSPATDRRTYFDHKHAPGADAPLSWTRGRAAYQAGKAQLRGNGGDAAVEQFVAGKGASAQAEPWCAELAQAAPSAARTPGASCRPLRGAAGAAPPLSAWLVTPRRVHAFSVED
ncbi:tRNA(Ala)(adenine(37)) deaminase [Malassezia sp. CBS 17886]|nr:tRNA(Ala)(adenine(37)) deaminase [Malassezia sp. CBS 17886]